MSIKRVVFIIALMVLLLTILVSADHASTQSEVLAETLEDVPIGLQRLLEANQKQTLDFSVKISFFIAFVAGMLGILSPCILPFLPAYFSYTFKEKKNITLMTFIFFLGFSTVFVGLGIFAGIVGETSLSILQTSTLINISGAFLIVFGLMSLFGKGFSSFIHITKKFKNDIPGTFLFGMAFAAGWTACLGPILAGILSMGALFHSVFLAAILMLFYSLGNLIPLFLISIFYDKYNLSESKLIKGRVLKFNIDEKTYEIHSTNLISGLLFLGLGAFILIFGGTGPVNTWDWFDTKQYFYSLQDKLIAWQHANTLGVIVFILFIGLIAWFIWSKRKNG